MTMRGFILAVATLLVASAFLLGPASALRAADVTDVPAGVSTAAVAAFKRGLELHKAGQWTAAIQQYERAIALGGRFPEAFNNLAYCYRKVGQLERAIDLYKTAIALRPLFVQAHDYLARTYLARGDRAAALREYEIVKRLDAKLAVCLWAAIQRNDPDYHDMPWGSGARLRSLPVS